MSQTFGGLQVLSNVTSVTPTSTPTKYAQGWSALGPTPHGALDVVPSVANSNLTLIEGNYMLDFNASLLKVAMASGVLTFQAFLDGVALVGALCQLDTLDAGSYVTSFRLPINVAHGAPGVLDLRVSTSEGSPTAVTVTNANLFATRMD